MASNAALITVLNGTAPVYAPLTVSDVTGTSLDATTIQKLLDFLDSLCHMQMPGHAVTGLSGAAASSRLADFFMESGIAAKDVELIAKLYYQRLSANDRFQYVVNSNFINSLYIGNFNPENIEFYKTSLIDTCGYVPVYYPWDQRDLTDCFAALVVD